MTDLTGLRVMVLEDEASVALLIEDMLEELGCQIAVSIARMQRGRELAPTVECDFAVLDINLGGVLVFPVAAILKERKIPFLFSTGYGLTGLPEEFKGVPVVGKPFSVEELREKIAHALSQSRA